MKLAKSTNSYQLAPEGPTQGVVVDVVDMGMVEDTFNEGELVHKVRVVFQTEEETDEGVPFVVSTYPTKASLNSKANLSKYIKTILGRNLEETDFDKEGNVDLDALLIGRNAVITVEHNVKGENTYANVTAIGALTAKQQKASQLESRNYTRVQDRVANTDSALDTDDSDIADRI